ncbi:fimbrial protein [Enterobacter cancerogenus]|uniref:fimbrial protein n=1 Tax=Enterobacter cancerogenus TaxID=69218 RepID=UPI0023612A40|nr:fimbrial protein [Enterobacter cancerogenus]
MTKWRMKPGALAAIAMVLSPGGWAISTAPTLTVKVTVISQPCVIPSGEENITLGFGSVVTKDLYAYTRTTPKDFAIHLAKCDTRLAKTVKVTFSGTEDPALPGLLALDAGSEGKGIAIGLETAAGAALKLNQVSDAYTLMDGDNRISMKAYAQIEPDAQAKRSLNEGAFRASAVFTLDYE